jgi:predicted MFS family arabinose efflux permease
MVMAVGVPRMPLPVAELAEHEAGYWSSIAFGFRYIARQPLVRVMVLLVVVTNAIDAAGMTVLKPVYAIGVDPDGAFLGAMFAFFAGGALTGAAAYSAVGHRLPQRSLLIVAFVIAGVTPYAAMALGLPAPVLLVLIAISGFAAGPINPILDTALLALLPAALRARVFGAIAACVAAAMPLGALLAGLGVERWGLLPCLIAAAVLYGAATLSTALVPQWRQLDLRPHAD